MSNDAVSEFEYYEGFYSFRTAQIEVLMDEVTFDTHMHAYLVHHGVDTRSEAELLAYVADVQQQRREAEKVLQNPDYWRAIADPNVRVIRRDTTHQQGQVEEGVSDTHRYACVDTSAAASGQAIRWPSALPPPGNGPQSAVSTLVPPNVA